MNKKQKIAVIAMVSLVGITTTWASDDYYRGDRDGFIDKAKVINVSPVYKTVRVSTPRRECWNEERVEYRPNQHRSATPVVIGGLLGGVIGNRFGKGHGRDVATVAGVALGASIANDLNKNKHSGRPRIIDEQVCQTSREYTKEQQLDGYQVSYRYKGRTYVTHMDHHPGRKIRVHVQVSPVS